MEANTTMKYVISKENFGDAFVSCNRLFDAAFFKEEFTYTENDLGITYNRAASTFRLWAPTAEKVQLKLYNEGDVGNPSKVFDMTKDQKGTWFIKVEEDLDGIYYTFEITVGGKTQEAVDPYAKAAGVNGNRGMIIDLNKTNPNGWNKIGYYKLESPTDAVIYEMHIRDTSIDPSSGIKNAG